MAETGLVNSWNRPQSILNIVFDSESAELLYIFEIEQYNKITLSIQIKPCIKIVRLWKIISKDLPILELIVNNSSPQ